jgi:hypothetical protein
VVKDSRQKQLPQTGLSLVHLCKAKVRMCGTEKKTCVKSGQRNRKRPDSKKKKKKKKKTPENRGKLFAVFYLHF